MEDNELNISGENYSSQALNNFQGEFQNTNDMNLSNEMVANAIERACDFFHLPKVPVYNAEGSCVWPNNPTTTYDDAFGFNRQELMNLGINGEDSLTLVYTHECAHRALQSYKNLDSWEHELACDFFSGIHAGMKGIDAQNVCESLGKTHGSLTHPTGTLRADYIEYGIEVAKDMDARKIPITFESCLERFNQHLIKEDTTIKECRNAVNNLITLPNDTIEHPLGFSNSDLYKDSNNEAIGNSTEERNKLENWESKLSLIKMENTNAITFTGENIEDIKREITAKKKDLLEASHNVEYWTKEIKGFNTKTTDTYKHTCQNNLEREARKCKELNSDLSVLRQKLDRLT